jgi:hypothetical protein
MKQNKSRLRRFAVLLTLFYGLVASNCSAGETPGKIEIHDYKITVRELKKPLVRIINKQKVQFDREYFVQVKATMPPIQAKETNFYIGKYHIPQYGDTKDGFYFIMYDLHFLESLEDGEFAYSTGDGKRINLKVKFKPLSKKPYPKAE